MVSVITKKQGQRKFLISRGWKPNSAKAFVKERRKWGYFATTLTKNQDKKIREQRHITKPLIKKIKRKY